MTPEWLNEKSANIIKTACYLLMHVIDMKADMSADIYHPRHDLYLILFDATKIFCSSLGQIHDDSKTRWSPELVDYLFDHPEKCEETLGIVASKDYGDQYYDEDFRKLFRPQE